MVFAYDNRVSGGPMGRYARLALAEREEIMLLRWIGYNVLDSPMRDE
jgi:hypothetical protein